MYTWRSGPNLTSASPTLAASVERLMGAVPSATAARLKGTLPLFSGLGEVWMTDLWIDGAERDRITVLLPTAKSTTDQLATGYES
jgi:hypothetical protein